MYKKCSRGGADENYYKVGLSSSIKCKDGTKKINHSQLNDDFCDCLDGSDEPGTSACPNGKFYCKNVGHAPLVIYSSRVNDGICDCCDGSDEYDGKIKCVNTCWESGKVAREKLKKKIETYQKGVTIRNHEVEQAKLAIARDEAELSKIRNEEKILKRLVQQLKESKEQIEKAEEKERMQKEKEEKERMEAEVAIEKETKADKKSEDVEHAENDIHDKIGIVNQPPQDSAEDHHESVSEPELSDHPINEGLPDDEIEDVKEDYLQNTEGLGEGFADGKVGTNNGNQEKNVAEDSESLSREELGRLVASRWTGEKTEQETPEEDASVDEGHQNLDETPKETNDEEYNGYDSEEDEHNSEDDDNEESQVDDFEREDHYDSSSSHKHESDDELDLSDWSDTAASSSSSWLEKIQKTVKSVLLAVNLFQTPVNISDAAHVRKEYEKSSAKLSKIRYVYKVCPFKQATQEEGYSTTNLGSWEKFEESYRIMVFLNGDKCWNGPDRSLKVKLRCGLKNEVTDIDEPSRCEYLALLSTPALCVDTKLKELQEKLESLNKEQPQGHDEL
ncbi:hypothetical protein RD792_003029 [Penstemon davidsonii]|uniref:Glucosidase 2 subunit beta n=1 Tax=Penstemon davidsonii TaxID=160366 RepID=A0ABR0DSK6_9LAMI|nr:hypothetical protein RD792_003029 [Penstemon davidsonii]